MSAYEEDDQLIDEDPADESKVPSSEASQPSRFILGQAVSEEEGDEGTTPPPREEESEGLLERDEREPEEDEEQPEQERCVIIHA